ncbi:hypothetical protein QAD02_008753 [Eretmocerus hayati]|uniref:Uncharacterized protein n=1 Tax=Eretmocerus hayati TaxID=131215 RepID=A0ACC2N8R6_9HYME|nr:hypothetical protein QAD02_008753 [Eretmocerus hayati]
MTTRNLEKMELDDKDGANNNLKGTTESIKREECTSSSKENIKVPNKQTKKKVRPKKSPNESLHRKKDGRKISVGASKKLKSPKDPHLRILKKRSLNADVVSSTCSSKRKSNERSKSDAESSSSVTWKRPKSPLLRTAERAKAKRYRQELRKQKEKQIEEMRQKILEEQRRKEEEEFQKLRQQTVFKAAPIRKYAPLPQVKKRALTEPVSPNIRKRRRTGSSSRCCSSNQTE